MSTNKKFRIQNGVDITGEVVVGNQLVITAEGKLVLPAIEGAISDAVSADIAALQAQVDAILGTSPEHLDTLQEIVALFQSEDGDISTLITNNSTAITQIQQTLASGVATAAQGALADTAAQQSDLDAVIAQITDGVATAAQGALADTAVQPEDFGAGLESVTSSSLDLTSVLGDVTTTYIPSDIEYNGEGLPLYTGRFWGAWSGWKNNHGGAYDLALVTHDQLGYANNLNGAALPTVLVMGNFEGGGDPAFVGTQLSGPAGSQFGSSLTFNDNYIVVGAKNQSSNEGAIHVYTTDANSFIRKTDTITGSDISGNTNGEFGSYAVMVPGADEVIVSEPKSQDLVGQNHWGGRVYHINLADGSLIKEFTVPNPRYNMQLGDGYYGGMVIKGDNLFVCESGVPGGNSKVHQFSISTGTHIRELVAPDGPNMERFGSALAIVGDYLVVGERVEGEDIFVFDMDGNLTSSIIVDSPSHDGWCLARALDDNTVVMKSGTDVLNPSSFHVFNVDSSGVISLSFIHSEDVTDINTFNDTIVTVNAGDYNTTTPDQTIKLLTPSSITTTSFEVDTSTIATKAYVDSGVAGVDLSDYSTTTQMDSAIAVETAAAIAAIPATDLTTYSTTVEMDSAIATAKSEAQTYADQVVADTVDAAPAALDTLNELAAALGDDANFASTVTASLADKVSTYTFDNKVSELQQDINLKADKTVNFNITGAASSGSPVIINEDGTISAIGTSVPVSELSELVTSDSMEITNQAENWATVYNMTGDYPLNDNYARQRQMLVAEPIQISNDANGNERFLHAFAQGEDTHLAVYAVIDGVLTYVSRSVDEKSPGWIQDMAYNSTSNTVLLVGRNHYSSKIFYSGVTVSESGVIQFGNSMYSTQNRTQFWRTGNSVIVEPIADRFLCVSVDFGDWYTIVEQVNVTLGAETYVSLEKSQQVYNTGWNRPPRTSGGKLFSGPSTIGGGTSVYVAGNDTFPMTQDYNNNGDPAWKQRYIYQGARATVISWNSSTQEFNDFNGAWTYIDNGVGIDHVAGMTVGSDGSIHMIGFKGNPDISLDTMVIVKGLYNLNYSHTLTLGTNTPSSSELMFVDEGGKSPRWFASEFHGSTFARLSDGSFLLSFAYHNENVSIATISAEGVVTGVVDTGYAVGSGYDNKQWYPSDIQSKSFVSSSDEMYHIITRANYDSSTSDGQADSGWATHKLGSFIPDPATYLGIAQGDNGDVVISGGVVSGFTGLIPSTIYYVQSDGALSTTETNIKAGIAISENDILVSDNLDDAKQDLSPYATKEYVDSGVAGVDLSDYSTTTEMDSAIAVETAAAIAAIPATDLTPYSTTAQMDSSIATAKSEAQTYADQVVAATVDAAPAALNTLNELASALGDDTNFASNVTTSIATKADAAATTAALADKANAADLADKANAADLTTLETQLSGTLGKFSADDKIIFSDTQPDISESVGSVWFDTSTQQIYKLNSVAVPGPVTITSDMFSSMSNSQSSWYTPFPNGLAPSLMFADQYEAYRVDHQYIGDNETLPIFHFQPGGIPSWDYSLSVFSESDAGYYEFTIPMDIPHFKTTGRSLGIAAVKYDNDEIVYIDYADNRDYTFTRKVKAFIVRRREYGSGNFSSTLIGFEARSHSIISWDLIDTAADLTPYSTTAEMNAAIAAIPSTDLTLYSTTTEMDSAIAAIPATDLTPYSTTVEMDSAIATAKTEAQSYADQVVAATVDAAPAALDTLNELAAALGDDANFASTVTASISTKADDAATTAALATKADDAATTAALDSKADGSVVSGIVDYLNGVEVLPQAPSKFSLLDDPQPQYALNNTVNGNYSGFGETIKAYTDYILVSHDDETAGLDQSGSIFIYDRNDMENPVELYDREITGTRGWGNNFYYSEASKILMVANHDAGSDYHGSIQFYDLTDLSNITKVYQHTAPTGTGANFMLGYGHAYDEVTNKFYASRYGGSGNTPETKVSQLFVYDATNITATPVEINPSDIVGLSSIGPRDRERNLYWGRFLSAGGGYVYINDSLNHDHTILDTSDNSLVDTISLASNSRGVTIDDYFAVYNGANTYTLYNKGTSDIAFSITTPDSGSGRNWNQIYSVGNYYAIGRKGGGLHWYDKSDTSTVAFTNVWDAYGTGVYGRVSYDSIANQLYVRDHFADVDSWKNPIYVRQYDVSGLGSAFNAIETAIANIPGVDLSAYSTTVEMDSAIAAIPATDLTPYSTTVEMDSAIAAIPATDLTPYSTTVEMGSAIATAKSEAQSYADQVVASTIDAAPASLDTLNELAAALGDDANFASTVTASIATKADDAATTAALASKVGLAEVDVRMEPIKQLAESAIQPSDLGDGISSNSTTTQTWDVTTSQSVPSAPQGGEVQTVLTNGTGIFATYKGGSSTGAWGYGVYWKDLSVNQDYFIADISGSADWAKLGASSGLSDDYFVLAGQGKVAVWSTSDGSLVVEKARGLFSGSSTEFGGTVTLNGNKVIIGDFFADSEAGAVYVFDIISEQITKISNPDPSTYQRFSGASYLRDKMDGISSYGNKVLVGAPYANNDSFSSDGKVFVFDINDGSLIHTLSNPNGSDTIVFGVCSTVNDNYYVVGASQTKGSIGQYPIADSGAIFIYSATDGSYISTIENPGKGVGSSDDNQYGRAVKLSDGVLFVAAEKGDIGEGTDGSSDNKTGKIYLYEMSDNPTLIDTIDSPMIWRSWPLTPKLMDVSGTILVVGDISDNSSINYWSAIEVTGRAVISIDTSTIATKDYVDSGVAGVDLSAYSTTVEMDSAIAAIPSTDLTPYSTTAQMDSAIAVETGAREAAVTSAISTASDDATAKANAAQAAAEATASADATAKADAAQAAAIAAAGTAATQAIAATVDAAPASLDTLNELAAALGDDANFASTVTASIATKADDAATTAALDTKADDAATTAALATVTTSIATKADDAATTAALATKADDAATTAALASKVGLAEVDVRMEPIKQTAESAIQPSDLGTGIAETSSSVVDWSSLTSEDFAAISDTDLLYTKNDQVLAVDATDTHFVTLMMSNIPGDTSDTYRELTVNVHLLDGTLVKSLPATEDYPEMYGPGNSFLSVNGNYISLSRNGAAHDDTGTGSYSKIYDIRNIAQADHGLVKTINGHNLRRLFTIDDTRAIAVYGSYVTNIDTVKVHNISDWAELYSYEPMGDPIEADFGGGYFVTGGTTGNTNEGVTILKTSGAYGLAGTVFSTTIHGPSNNTNMYANGIAVSDKYVVFRTQDLDGTNRAHVHNPDDGSHIRSFVEDSNNPWQVYRNYMGLGYVSLALSGDALFIPLEETSYNYLKKGIAVYDILTGELLNELTVFDGEPHGTGGTREIVRNHYTVSGSTIIDMNEEFFDAGSISPRIATVPTTSVLSYGVDTSVFATKDYVDSGVDGNEGRLTTTENNLTALEADLSSEENARGAGDTALGLRLDSDKSELDTAIGSLSARLDSDKSELGAAIDAAIEQEVQTPLDLEIGRGSKSLRVGRNTVANTDGGIAIGDAANAAGAKSIALGTSATPTGDNGIEIKTSEDGTLSYSSDSDWSFGAPVTAPSFIGDGSGLTGISSDVTGAIAAEETRATTAEAGLQSQISNVLSNTDATALNSLAEIVTEFQNADSTLSGVIGGHGTRLTDLEGRTTDNIPEGITNKYYSDELVKTALSGGLCINDTKLQSTGEIAIDEVEAEQTLRVAEAVVSDDTSKLEGQDGSHYRIDIYDVNGVIIND